MKLLYFADIRFPLERANGIQTMETCHAVAGRGHHVTLVVRPDTATPPRDPFGYYGLPPTANLTIETAPVAGPQIARRAGYLSFAIGRALGGQRADALYTRDLGVAAALLRIPRAVRAPVVYESHGYSPEVSEALPGLVVTARQPGAAKLARLRAREERVWRGAEGYVTITEGLADQLRARFGNRDRLAVIPDGTRASGSPPDPLPPRADPIVGYAGHLYPWKGVDILLESLAQLPTARGLIVGGHEREPDLERLKGAAGALGIASRVTFTGPVAPSEVPQLLRKADVLALPNPASAISTFYTSPLKLFEYMAAGRPIVASDLPAIREVLRHEETALLVPPADPAALAAAVRRLASEPSLGPALARAASAAVRDYSWERRAGRIEALLERVVADRG